MESFTNDASFQDAAPTRIWAPSTWRTGPSVTPSGLPCDVAVRELTNERWGFETNCFVCERKNDGGLRIPFHHDDRNDLVTAVFTLGARFSGAPQVVHGGVVLAILDEAMAWATIAVGGKFAVTRETSARFHRPVKLERSYRVEARVTAQTDERIDTEAEVLDYKDRPCATARATFVPITAAVARDVIGHDGHGLDPTYLRDG